VNAITHLLKQHCTHVCCIYRCFRASSIWPRLPAARGSPCLWGWVLAGMLVASMSLPVLAQPGTTTRASVSSAGAQGDDYSESPSISADGRFVAFQSDATSLVPGDTNGYADIFVHDRSTGETARVSVSSAGEQGNGGSYEPSISADGRYVAFRSAASDLVPGDTNHHNDVFVHDRLTGETTRVSVTSAGGQGNGSSYDPSISADGEFVAFQSYASNLVPADTNGYADVFVHDRQTGETTRVSVSSSGNEGNDASNSPSISADGWFVASESQASDLVPGDTNGVQDVFVHDRSTGETTRVSVSSAGEQGNGSSYDPSMSAGGEFVAFRSAASDLVPVDTNNVDDIFVHDRSTGETTLVSVSSSGEQGTGVSYDPCVNADGGCVAFRSAASNLVPDDTNARHDIFVHNRLTGKTTRVSVSSAGEQGNGHSDDPSISADGRFVAFHSGATNLVADDTNAADDVFVHEREATYYDVSGTVTFDLLAGALPSSVEIAVTWNGWLFGNYEAALGPSGDYTLSLPAGPLTLSIKHTHWLRQTVPADTTGGPATGVDFYLINGDATDDNWVDMADLESVIALFGASDPMADLDEGGVVDLFDVNIVLLNFDRCGDP
jgi:Tol biopolymer transport system component